LNYYYLSKSATYISVDIECSGPVPIDYSMLSLGACVLGKEDNDDDNDYTFYVEIQPLSDNYVKEALEIAGFSMQDLKVKGTAPKEAMKNLLIGLRRCLMRKTNTRYL
jgi:ribonuclease T